MSVWTVWHQPKKEMNAKDLGHVEDAGPVRGQSYTFFHVSASGSLSPRVAFPSFGSETPRFADHPPTIP